MRRSLVGADLDPIAEGDLNSSQESLREKNESFDGSPRNFEDAA